MKSNIVFEQAKEIKDQINISLAQYVLDDGPNYAIPLYVRNEIGSLLKEFAHPHLKADELEYIFSKWVKVVRTVDEIFIFFNAIINYLGTKEYFSNVNNSTIHLSTDQLYNSVD